jgi:teichoic acid transport system ATP-binding protein
MLSDVAISVQNLTKTYRIFSHPGDRIRQALTFGRLHFHREFTALKNVSAEIKKGETVAIIGRNGSGKSTLLQLVCGILKPTTGTITVHGRVSALLELGAGFSPEFTGRENVYFQGAVMGLAKQEMDKRFDDIAAFADIGEFIDQPIRTYSSGMFVRLAFATAISVKPDILIVDEALSVGDIAFQTKCVKNMKQMITQGATVLFVTHDINMAKSLCQRAIYLESGQIKADGDCGPTCDMYLADQLASMNMLSSRAPPLSGQVFSDRPNRQGNGEARVIKATQTNGKGMPATDYQHGEKIVLGVWYLAENDLENLTIAFHIKNTTRQEILGTNTDIEQTPPGRIEKGKIYRTDFCFLNPLSAGEYSLSIMLAGYINGARVFFDIWDDALFIKSLDPPGIRRWAMVGVPTQVTHHLPYLDSPQ